MQTSLPDKSAGKVAWDEATGGVTRAQGTFGRDGSVCDLGFGNVSRVITHLRTNQTVHCKYAQLCVLSRSPIKTKHANEGGAPLLTHLRAQGANPQCRDPPLRSRPSPASLQRRSSPEGLAGGRFYPGVLAGSTSRFRHHRLTAFTAYPRRMGPDHSPQPSARRGGSTAAGPWGSHPRKGRGPGHLHMCTPPAAPLAFAIHRRWHSDKPAWPCPPEGPQAQPGECVQVTPLSFTAPQITSLSAQCHYKSVRKTLIIE